MGELINPTQFSGNQIARHILDGEGQAWCLTHGFLWAGKTACFLQLLHEGKRNVFSPTFAIFSWTFLPSLGRPSFSGSERPDPPELWGWCFKVLGRQPGLLAPAEKTSHLEEPTGFAVGASQGRRPPRGQDQLAL